MSSGTPQRFTPRAGSSMPGRIRRALDGQIDTKRRLGETLDIAPDGRMEVKAAKGGGLKMTRQGLMVDQEAVGEKNRPMLNFLADIPSGSATSVVLTKVNDLLKELRRTGHMRG